MQGPAQKGDLAADGVAAGQAADGLFHHGLEDGGRQILAGRAFVEQRHHVGLGEDAAAGRDGIDGGVARGQGIAASVSSRLAIWSMKAPVPPAQASFMRRLSEPSEK